MFSWVILFLIGFLGGAGLFYLVLFPLVYGLPRAAFGCVKGVYKWGFVRRLIVVPAIWSVLCASGIGEAFATNPNLITGLLSKPGILWGGWAALAFGLCSLSSDAVKRNFDWKSTEYIRTSGEQRPRGECTAMHAANDSQSVLSQHDHPALRASTQVPIPR
jgi:hypothetical protein